MGLVERRPTLPHTVTSIGPRDGSGKQTKVRKQSHLGVSAHRVTVSTKPAQMSTSSCLSGVAQSNFLRYGLAIAQRDFRPHQYVPHRQVSSIIPLEKPMVVIVMPRS